MGRAGKALIMGSLLALIMSAWLLSCKQQPPTDRIKADPLIVLPVDATIVGGVEIGSLGEQKEKPEFAKEMLGAQVEEVKEMLERIKTKANLNLPEDLDRVVFGLSNVGPQEPTIVALFQGRFDPEAITSAVKEEVQDCTFEDKTFDSYKYTVMGQEGDDWLAFGFPASEFAVLSNDEEALKTALGQFTKPAKSVMDNKEIASLLGNVDRTSNFWLAGLVPAEVEERVKDNPQAAALGKVKKFSMMLKATKGVDLELAGYCTTPEEATSVKDTIADSLEQFKFLFAIIPQGQELMKLYDKIQVTADGATAKLSLSLSEEEIKQLQETIAEIQETLIPEPMDLPPPVE